ncbi:MAG TPA: Ig-like domain-containing protein [Dissulfurispiraceae bacterium]|nr:Ig-like domain-containing protein [Dissulfurispiraceae bacterium]
MNWRVLLNSVDITAYCSGVQTRFEADAICGEVEVAIASRVPIAGLVVPRVPQSLSIAVDEHNGVAWVSRGMFFFEEIGYPQEIDAKTATLWGRTQSARLTQPWAQKISRQWSAVTTTAAIMTEMAALCGVTLSISQSYPVCQYCYAVSDQTPAEIIRDLATRSAMELWPMPDGSLSLAPRLYTYGSPSVTLDSAEIVIDAVDRQQPDFGNRVLVSGDGAVAGLSVQILTVSSDEVCVAADGQSRVRLMAVVTGPDGQPVASGTKVTWTATAGMMSQPVTQTQTVSIVGERVRASSFRHVVVKVPPASVSGVYAAADHARSRNLYSIKRGSVSGRAINFASSLDFYDQALVIDYTVAGAPGEWIAGRSPGDVTVLATVAGAQGMATIHQSNPTACASQISLAAVPTSACLGDAVTVTLKAVMFGGAGLGVAQFALSGCGSLSHATRTMTHHNVVEIAATTVWGGASEARIEAVPVAGSTPHVELAVNPGGNLYQSHSGQVVRLNTPLSPGTRVRISYAAGGTALVTWTPKPLPAGSQQKHEWLYCVTAGGVARVELTRTPLNTPVCIPYSSVTDKYASHAGRVVTLALDPHGNPYPTGEAVYCHYYAVWPMQSDCEAELSVRIPDGSENGGVGMIKLSARDCRTVVDPGSFDPGNPGNNIDEPGGVTWPDPDENPKDAPWPDLKEAPEEPVPTSCTSTQILMRTPGPTGTNWDAVSGVSGVDDCPGTCSCSEICGALMSSGALSKAGTFYSVCVSECTKARSGVCAPCTLSGPAVLAPGATGTWTDSKGNTGEVSGGLTLVSRTVQEGYTMRMPSGGTGPFTVRVCYGPQQQQCCEAQVDYATCSLSGPSILGPGAEGEYIPSLGMAGATIFGTMEQVRKTDTAFVMRHTASACSGWLSVSYGGQMCGILNVALTISGEAGTVAGPSIMQPDTSDYFAVGFPSGNLDGLTYTGTLEMVQQSGGGAILRMPAGAAGSYTASWTARCGRTASKSVESRANCAGLPQTGFAASPIGLHVGLRFSGPQGMGCYDGFIAGSPFNQYNEYAGGCGVKEGKWQTAVFGGGQFGVTYWITHTSSTICMRLSYLASNVRYTP